MKNKLVHRSIIATFVSLYLLVSIISTIHVVEFFRLSNPQWLAISLAIAFELGAAASLASLVILDKMNRTLIWCLFCSITLMQMQGNMYYAFVHLENFQGWSELFGIIEEEVVYQKRVLSAVSGAILPLVALGFIKSLVDYIKPESQSPVNEDPRTEEISIGVRKEEILAVEEKGLEIQKVDLDPIGKESDIDTTEKERDEDHDLDIVLNQIAEDLDETPAEPAESEEGVDFSQTIPGYYGDIVIDGNGIQVEESNILPVNSNAPTRKNTGIIDNSGGVHINPTRL